jgi:hypothetical protein
MPAAVVLAGACACDRGPGPDRCYDVCGAGTQCVQRRCVIADAADLEEAEPEDDGSGKKRRRGRRGRGKGGAEPAIDASDFKPVDDSHIPRYDANRVQHIDMKSGTERLADETIRAHLRRLESKFNRCIEVAASYSPEEIASGDVDFVFSIEKSGKVSGINVKAPKHLRVFGIVPCLRKTVYDHAFPSYDGPPTGVDYSFKVG